MALLEAFNADLLAGHSATQTLAAWCAAHNLHPAPRIRAEREAVSFRPLSAEQRERLSVGSDEQVAYRRVRLMCGNHVLSVADNWFLPDRLTADIRYVLATSDTPFGAAIRSLAPVRHPITSRLLWPLPGSFFGIDDMPVDLLHHHALVLDGAGRALAEVSETYRSGLFAFALSQGKASGPTSTAARR